MLTNLEKVGHACATLVVSSQEIDVSTAGTALGAQVRGALCRRLAQGSCFVQLANVTKVSCAADHAAGRGWRGAVGTMWGGSGDQVAWVRFAHLCVELGQSVVDALAHSSRASGLRIGVCIDHGSCCRRRCFDCCAEEARRSGHGIVSFLRGDFALSTTWGAHIGCWRKDGAIVGQARGGTDVG